VSIHRYENIFNKEQLLIIVDLLEKIAIEHQLLFILHPPTINQLKKYNLLERVQSHNRIKCVSRLNHSDFLALLQSTEFVITDGGSLQEETAYLGIPCLIFRQATERLDGLGESAVLSCFQEEVIFDFISSYKKWKRNPPNFGISPSEIIVEDIRKFS
jgi:UDP-N-acetylglucosamine 2-epimerase (non-hydrolysing)